MPVLTISAVDSATEQITSAAHGLVTGDGPIAIYTAAGVLPSPLVGATDYFAIRVDANTIKLATSSANALAGTAINLTTNGSGTLLLQLGIPYRRARTYVALSQLKSADLDAMQDSHTALYDLLTGQAQSIYSGVTLAGALSVGGAFTITGDIKHGAREIVLSASAFVGTSNYATSSLSLGDIWTFSTPPNDTIQANIPLRVGDRILAITWFFNKASNATALTMKLRKRNGTTNTDIDTLADVTSGAAFTSVTRSSINSTIATGDATFLKVGAGAAVHQFSHASISYDHP